MLKILLILCELYFITFTTFTYFTLCLQIDTLFTSPDFCLKLAISCFQCKDKHIVYHFYFLLEVKIFVTFYVKINMWSTILNFCLNSNCCHIFDFLLDNKSSFLNILREDRKTANHFSDFCIHGLHLESCSCIHLDTLMAVELVELMFQDWP